MYHDDPMDANPKGEIFIGNIFCFVIYHFLFVSLTGYQTDGYSIRIGVLSGVKDQGFSFMLTTPDRVYNLSAQTEIDRDHWIEVLERVIDRPLTPQDLAGTLCHN